MFLVPSHLPRHFIEKHVTYAELVILQDADLRLRDVDWGLTQQTAENKNKLLSGIYFETAFYF